MSVEIRELVGQTFSNIDLSRESILLKREDGGGYRLEHDQDCCEVVDVNDICGNVTDLLGSPIIRAEERSSADRPDGVDEPCEDSETWTFYELATAKGSVTIRWFGRSNGYYSEEVSLRRIEPMRPV